MVSRLIWDYPMPFMIVVIPLAGTQSAYANVPTLKVISRIIIEQEHNTATKKS